MICGTGIDLFLTKRFDPHRHDPDFLSQIFTLKEIEGLERSGPPRNRPAMLFTLKEAALKARGNGLNRGWAWRTLAVTADDRVIDADQERSCVIHAAGAQCRRYSLALVLFEDRTRRTTA